MAYTDPQSVTVDGTANSLSRVLTGTTVGRFVSPDGVRELTIDPRGSRSRRRNVAREYKQTSTTIGGIVVNDRFMVSTTIDRPLTGVSDVEIEKELLGHIAWLTANSNANLKKLIAGEN